MRFGKILALFALVLFLFAGAADAGGALSPGFNDADVKGTRGNSGRAKLSTATVQAKANPTTITKITPSHESFDHEGGECTITLEGTNLPDEIEVAIYDENFYYYEEILTTGSETKQTAELTVPPNPTDTLRTYYIDCYSDETGGLKVATITVSANPNPAKIEKVSPNPATLESTGGECAITLEGKNLPDGIVVDIIDQDDSRITFGETTGDTVKQDVTLYIPGNVTSADATYRIVCHFGDGVGQPTEATITLEASPTPVNITKVTAAPKSFGHRGDGQCTITLEGENLVDGIFVEIFDQDDLPFDAASTNGDATSQAVTFLVSSNSTATERTYTVHYKLLGGRRTKTEATITVDADPDAPIVTNVSLSTKTLPSEGGQYTITLTGTNLRNGIYVGIGDQDGFKFDDGWTTGGASDQKVTLTMPPNSTATEKTYSVYYQLPGESTTPTTETITVKGSGGGGSNDNGGDNNGGSGDTPGGEKPGGQEPKPGTSVTESVTPEDDGSVSATIPVTTEDGKTPAKVEIDAKSEGLKELEENGLSVSVGTDGQLLVTGEPKEPGTYTITVIVTDAAGNKVEKVLTIVVEAVAKAGNAIDAIEGNARTTLETAADGTTRFTIFITTTLSAADTKDLSASGTGIDGLKADFDGPAASNVSAAYAAPRAASDGTLRITGRVTNYDKAAITSVTYRVGINKYTQKLDIRLADTQVTDNRTEQPGGDSEETSSSSGGGCTTGIGLGLALLLATAPNALRTKRRSR